MKKKLGFVGLGLMGSEICGNLIKSGEFEVSVFDRDEKKYNKALKLGGKPTYSLDEIALESDVIACSLPNPQVVKEVLCGTDGIINNVKPGAVIFDFSSNDPETVKEVAAVFAEKNARYIDCPVSGGPREAEQGTLVIIAGSKEEELTEFKDMLDAISGSVHYAGAVGSASVIKLVNNVMSMGNVLIAAEAYVLGAKAGVDGGTLFNILQHCGGRSHHMLKRFPNVLKGNFEPGYTVDLAEKDLSLALEMARKLKMPMFATNICREFYLSTSRSGKGSKDCVAVVEALEELVGVQVREK